MDSKVLSGLLPWLKEKGMWQNLLRGSLGSFFLQAGFAGLSFANALLLARVLGPRNYGAYSNAVAWITILTIPSTFGFDILLVRNVASYLALNEHDKLAGLLRFSNRFVLIASLLVVVLFYLFASQLLFLQAEEIIKISLWLSLPLVPLLALLSIESSVLRGFEYVLYSRLPVLLIRPGLMVLGALAIYYFQSTWADVTSVIAINAGATIIALFFANYWKRKVQPIPVHLSIPKYSADLWVRAAFFVMVYVGAQTLLGQISIVMLGLLGSAEMVGLFSVVIRLACLLVFALTAVDAIAAPIISRLNALDDRLKIQAILTKTVRIAFLVDLIPAFVLLVWPEQVLHLFGDVYTAGRAALFVVVIGQLLNVATGSGAVVLFITGRERLVAFAYLGAVVFSVGLNIVIIPVWGVFGAAIVTTVTIAVINLFLGFLAVKLSGFHTTILGTWGRFL